MATNWKCARCGTDNAETAVSCQGCGMIRGAVVTNMGGTGTIPPAPPPAMPSPPASSAMAGPGVPGIPPVPGMQAGQPLGSWQGSAAPLKPRRRRIPIPVSLILLVLIIGGGAAVAYFTNAGRSANGDINKAGDLAIGDLRVGDCFDLADPTASSVDTTSAKPCTDSHQYEVFYAGQLPDGDYPTDAAVKAFVQANCLPVFTTYVGMSFDNSKLDIVWFSPIVEAWDQGSRGIQCTVYDPNNSHLTASLKGANR